MNKIIIGSASFSDGHGGIAKVARLCALSLAEEGLNTKNIALSSNNNPYKFDIINPAICKNKLNFIAHIWRESIGASFCLFMGGGVARARINIPFISRPYGVFIFGIEAWENIKPAQLRAIKQADLVISITKYTLEKFERLHGALPNAVVCHLSTEETETVVKSSKIEPTVLIVSRIDKSEMYKGHRELIEAWPSVCATVPNARLIIAGGGNGLDEIKKLAQNSIVRDNIDVLGYVESDKMTPLWERASVYAMPSRGEGFGLVYIEAMRRGIPVIASIHDAGQEVNKDGMTGFNVDLEKPLDLSEKIIYLLTNKDVYARLSRNCQAEWSNNYSFDKFKKRFLEILKSKSYI